MMNKYFSRKFVLALIFAISGCAGLFLTDKIDGGNFIALVGIVLGAFTAGDVALNAIHRKNSETSE
jgi:hypothetical protein